MFVIDNSDDREVNDRPLTGKMTKRQFRDFMQLVLSCMKKCSIQLIIKALQIAGGLRLYLSLRLTHVYVC